MRLKFVSGVIPEANDWLPELAAISSRFVSVIAVTLMFPVRAPVVPGSAGRAQGKVKDVPSAVVASKIRSIAGNEGTVHR